MTHVICVKKKGECLKKLGVKMMCVLCVAEK